MDGDRINLKIQWLLELSIVRVIDLSPQVDIDVERLLDVALPDIGSVEA